MSELISVIIPSYQHADALPACLDSVLAQNYPSVEVIVVDDGSTDNTGQVLERYKDRVQVIAQENQGANPARNRGLQEAKGAYVIFCDADVTMKPHMLSTLYEALQRNSHASYAYSAFTFGWKIFQGIPFNAERLREHNYVHTTSLVRRGDFPGFDNHVKRLQDWDVWLTMLEQGKQGVLVPEVLFSVAVHGESRIGSSWLPRFAYKVPWRLLPWQPQAIAAYERARAVISDKHQL